jgi:hypothetical protein
MKEKNLPLWTGINGGGMAVWWVAFGSLWAGRFGQSLMDAYGSYTIEVMPAAITFWVWPFAIALSAVSFGMIHQKGQAAIAGTLGVPYLLGHVSLTAWAYAMGTGRFLTAAWMISLSVIFFSLAYHRLHEEEAPLRMTMGLSVLLAWLSATTVLAWALTLQARAWLPFVFTPMEYAMIVIMAALFIASVLLFQKRDWIFSLVVVWGMEGIAEATQDPGFRMVIVIAMTLLILFVLTMFTWRVRGHSRISDSFLN